MDEIPYRRHPCRTCPWRRATVGRIAFDNLADYAAGTFRTADGSPELGDVMFACHRHEADLCAGWLVVSAVDHPTVRLALALGLLPRDAIEPGTSWPELYDNADEMLAAHRRALLVHRLITEEAHG